MSDDTNGHTADLIHELTATSQTADQLDDTDGNPRKHVVMIPAGWKAEHLDAEHWEQQPYRSRGVANFTEIGSFLDHLDRIGYGAGVAPRLPVYADREHTQFVAVLNDDSEHGAGWRDFGAALNLTRTEGWEAVVAIDEERMTAPEMADWLEEWRHLVAEPSWSDLAQIARKFRATAKMEFRQELDESNGDTALEYVRTSTVGGAEHITPPERVVFAVPVFYGTDPVRLDAMFRWRVEGGTVRFHLKLVQPRQAERDGFDLIADLIGEHRGMPVLHGTPAPART